MQIGKKILGIVFVIFILIQFYRPQKNNAEYRDVTAFETETEVDTSIKTILQNNCYDCHSNKTTYPWYAEIAPISLWINHHIEEGKEHFNVSQWSAYNDKKKKHKLEELIEEVEEEKMPLDAYTWLHGSLTKTEQEALIQWAKKTYKHYKNH